MSKAKTKTAEPQEESDLPKWFDPAKHSAGDGGIFETATGTLLAADGEPLSEALRIQRKAAAEAAEKAAAEKAAAEAAAEAETPAPAELPHHSV